MENIRLPEDFTDRVMHRIEARERAAARRTRAAAVAGGILGGVGKGPQPAGHAPQPSPAVSSEESSSSPPPSSSSAATALT